MNPDEQHQKYFKENPLGNHSIPSPETKDFINEQRELNQRFLTVERFSDHINNYEKLSENVDDIQKELGTKVSWVVFWSIIVLLAGVVGTSFTLLYNAIKDVQATSYSTQNTVSYIKGVLDNAAITR